MADKLEALKRTEAKQQQALVKHQQALQKAQQARKQEETRRNQLRWMLLGQTLESVLHDPALAHFTPKQIFDMWELIGRFLADPSSCDLVHELITMRDKIVAQQADV
jgi:hypothetical protein